MTTIDLTAYFEAGTLDAFLAALPEKAKKAAMEVLDRAADRIEARAKQTVRIKTGALKNSIRKQRLGDSVFVTAGNMDVNYAGIIEQRYPYLKPAFDSQRPYIRPAIIAAVTKELT